MTSSEQLKLPVIGITVGDPAGIGPEIVLKALKDEAIYQVCRPVLIGDVGNLEQANMTLGIGSRLAAFSEDGLPEPNCVEVYDLANISGEIAFGEESDVTGRASAEFIETAVQLWQIGKIDAIATAPISKNALKLAGYNYPGHTEFLATLTDTQDFAMSFFAEKLRVVLLSTHISLRNAIDLVTTESLVELIRFSNKELPKFIGKIPKIAVAGINPHASEGGMFGDEEARHIVPAIKQCLGEGIDVSGPFSPDTIFLRGFRGEFDLVVACYHDQATIAVKSLSFGSSVNVTLGLPLIRTSVDHGTAFDIAGQGIAEESSMKAAIRLAAELVANRRVSVNL
ncbi:MAG TPA: 4-hydroxythreonine-4-phosphate dehydrogenase PdxA [Pyrinomonadaceae bacterium]|nr:4-hydroxythreonine-4-phosphate dehydrogenase PdxA [Pyrinomonadaceae bacterium]